jgi:hypothetical protein
MATSKQPSALVGGTRAAVGQGLMMGWGDEAEAWLRSKLGEGEYQDVVNRIRKEYGQYSDQNPVSSALAEFGGGVVPGVAAMFVPGGQAAGAAQIGTAGGSALARLAARPITKSIAAGTTTGAISGAGSSTEDNRGSGAVTGGVMGGAFGLAIPTTMRTAGGVKNWLTERLFPSEAKSTERAARKMTEAITESGLTPQQIERKMAQDRALNVPSVIANVDPNVARLAETVAQRTGAGTRKVEKAIETQQAGSKQRTYQQVQKSLQPGDYYGDEARLMSELRNNASSVYDNAYAMGDVDDPRVIEALKNPQFQQFWSKARSIADTEAQAAKLRGEDPSKFALPEIYKPSGKRDSNGNEILELTKLPDVRTLDYIKRGIDASIDSGFRGQGMSTAEANALRQLRREFVNAIDENVPAYKVARQQYAGDIEVLDALRAGYNDFGKLDHEQVIDMVGKMSNAEKEAFRTGVVRDLYGKMFGTSRNINAPSILEAPETKLKLQPLFDNPGQFRLFEAAIERESQLFKEANKILRGSQTGQRKVMQEKFEDEGEDFTSAAAQALTGGWMSSLTGLASRALYKTTMTEDMADKLAGMLMSRDPKDVAAVVKILEDYAERAAPKAAGIQRRELGATTGAAISAFPAPTSGEGEADIDAADSGALQLPEGPDIDADIEAELNKTRR